MAVKSSAMGFNSIMRRNIVHFEVNCLEMVSNTIQHIPNAHASVFINSCDSLIVLKCEHKYAMQVMLD